MKFNESLFAWKFLDSFYNACSIAGKSNFKDLEDVYLRFVEFAGKQIGKSLYKEASSPERSSLVIEVDYSTLRDQFASFGVTDFHLSRQEISTIQVINDNTVYGLFSQ